METWAREQFDGGFAEAVTIARDLQAAPGAALHDQLRKLLITLARSYDPAEDRRTLPPRTLVQRVRDPDTRRTAIEGEVLHWLRPRSAWRELRGRRDDGTGRRLNEQLPNLTQDLEPLAMHWNREPPIVGRVDPGDDVLEELVDLGQVRLGSLKVALCPLVPGATPRFRTDETGRFFYIDRARPISDPEHLRDHLVAVLAEAARWSADIVVLPELCIDPAARRMLVNHLAALRGADHRFLTVIAGSFHIWQRGTPRPINEAVVLGPRGTSTWNHVKHGTFTMSRDHVLKHRGRFFPDDLREDHLADQLVEHIENGRELLICDSRIGRLAMVICADILQPGSHAEALKTWIRPDFLFIVSMSPRTEGFLAEAEAMLRCHVSTFYVNAHCVCEPRTARSPDAPVVEPPDLAFALLAVREHSGLPPTRIGLYSGETRPRYYDLHDKVWRVMADDRGAAALATGGLLVYVGAQFGPPPG